MLKEHIFYQQYSTNSSCSSTLHTLYKVLSSDGDRNQTI